jgi:hypothetical protein
MKQQQPTSRLRAASPIFLALGLIFFAVGLATNQDVFTWIAVAFLTISLVTSGKWLTRRP